MVGDVQLAQGDIAAALQVLPLQPRHQRPGVGEINPGNTGWQHDLSVALRARSAMRRWRKATLRGR